MEQEVKDNPIVVPGGQVVKQSGHEMDTMAETIALSSPSGRMSARARKTAEARLRLALFGPSGLQLAPVPQPTERERLLRQAAELRALAARGMKPRAYLSRAAVLEAQAKRDKEAGE